MSEPTATEDASPNSTKDNTQDVQAVQLTPEEVEFAAMREKIEAEEATAKQAKKDAPKLEAEKRKQAMLDRYKQFQ